MDRLKDMLPTFNSIDVIRSLHELSSGSYGSVYVADTKHGKQLAVKVMRKDRLANLTQSEIDMETCSFYEEAFMLSAMNHPNVLGFELMISNLPDGLPGMATEFMAHGSLSDCIKRGDVRLRSWDNILCVAEQVAKGMAYLHSRRVVHFDLKCANVLVDYNYGIDPTKPICKVADLGLALVKGTRAPYSGMVPLDFRRGTLTYMAPEVMRADYKVWKQLVTDKVDVYSFGILMWELLMGEQPYKNMTAEEIESGVLRGRRPRVPEWCNSRWKALMEECWAQSEHARPSFEAICRRLHRMVLVQKVMDIINSSRTFSSPQLLPKTFYCQVCKESEEAEEEIVDRMIDLFTFTSLPYHSYSLLVGEEDYGASLVHVPC